MIKKSYAGKSPAAGEVKEMPPEKINTGVRAGDIVAIVFMALGGIFTALGIVMALHLDELRAHGTGDVKVLPLVFTAVGLPFLVTGIVIALVSLRRRARLRRVVNEGHYVMADVADIRPNFSVQVNGACPYVLECHYRDPATGTLHIFKSRNLFFYPAELENRPIRVYVNRENMKDYYVDVDGQLADVQTH